VCEIDDEPLVREDEYMVCPSTLLKQLNIVDQVSKEAISFIQFMILESMVPNNLRMVVVSRQPS